MIASLRHAGRGPGVFGGYALYRRTDSYIALTFSGLDSSGMPMAPSSMNPPPLPTFSIRMRQ